MHPLSNMGKIFILNTQNVTFVLRAVGMGGNVAADLPGKSNSNIPSNVLHVQNYVNNIDIYLASLLPPIVTKSPK